MNTEDFDEITLLQRLKDDDGDAFIGLYNHYHRPLFAYILRFIKVPALAEDVLQDVFVKIWQNIQSYDVSKGRLFTWMLNIARNASIDTLRSRTYQNSRKNRSLPDNVDGSGFAQSAEFNVDNIGVKKSLEKLREDHRVLIELAYFKGYTHEEIAEIETIPLGTVKTRLRNALLQLREHLK